MIVLEIISMSMNPCNRIQKMKKSQIREMFELAKSYDEVISLGMGAPDFPTPTHIINAGCDASRQGFTKYTPSLGFDDLKVAIAEKLEKNNLMTVNSVNEVIVTGGSREGLAIALLSTINAGKEVIIPDPGWTNYPNYIRLAEGIPVPVNLSDDNDFMWNIDELKSHITNRSAGIIVNTPTNPTGTVIDPQSLLELGEFAAEYDLWVFADESYEAITYDGVQHQSIASYQDMFERVISIFSFSKTFSMTGWRLGYNVAPPDLIEAMNKVHEPIMGNAPSMVQKVGIAALMGSQEPVKYMLKEYSDRRRLIIDELADFPLLTCFPPKGTFFAWIKFNNPSLSSYEFCRRLLNEEHVVTVPGSGFGVNGEGYMRISFVTPKERLQTAINRIKAFAERIK